MSRFGLRLQNVGLRLEGSGDAKVAPRLAGSHGVKGVGCRLRGRGPVFAGADVRVCFWVGVGILGPGGRGDRFFGGVGGCRGGGGGGGGGGCLFI